MLPTLRDWSRRRLGPATLLTPIDAPVAGAIEYIEEFAAARSLDEVLGKRTPWDEDFAIEEIGPVDERPTAEGEQAACVTIRGQVAGRPMQIDVGHVFTDRFCTRVLGVAVAPDHFPRFSETVRRLVHGDALLLGARPRRCRYLGPEGWRPVDAGLVTDWIREDEDDPSVLTVWPAIPRAAVEGPWPAHLDVDDLVRASDEPWPVETEAGLQGQVWELSGRGADGAPASRDLVVLEDDRYVYSLALEGSPAACERDRSVLLALAGSLEPIPHGTADGCAVESRRTLFGHWC